MTERDRTHERPLNLRHYRALAAFSGRSELSSGELTRAIGGYATQTIRSLEERGLLARLPAIESPRTGERVARFRRTIAGDRELEQLESELRLVGARRRAAARRESAP